MAMRLFFALVTVAGSAYLLFTDRGEPLYRMAQPMTLGAIPADVLVPFIRERFAAGRSQISADAAGYLVMLTEGNPIQALFA